ncbi:MAG: polysaccharide lyase [bacterium]
MRLLGLVFCGVLGVGHGACRGETGTSARKTSREPDPPPKHAAPGGLLFQDDFEAGHLKRWSFRWLFLRTSARIVATPVRHGKGALEVTLRRSDPMRSKGKRSELMVPGHFDLGKEYWYGFSVYLPKDWQEDFQGEVVTQWFATRDRHLGERPRSPSLALRIKKRSWIVNNRWDPNPLSVGNTAPKEKLYKGDYERGVWTDWVFQVHWSYRRDGLVRVWKNGRVVATKRGPNTYNDRVGPVLKLGLYKAPWNKPETPSTVSARRIFFDEVRVGGREAGYRGVAPRATRKDR